MTVTPESLARHLAAQATCERRGVGAVAVDASGAILGASFNQVRGGAHCERCTLPYDLVPASADYTLPGQRCPAVHAEEGAIVQGGMSVVKVYVTTDPCDRCEDLMARLGIEFEIIAESLADRSVTL